MPNTKFPLLQIPNRWRKCVAKFWIHHLRNKFGELPRLQPLSKCHTGIFKFSHNIFTFTLTINLKLRIIKDPTVIFYSMYSTLMFCCYLEFEASQVKTGLLMWCNLIIKFQILLQTIIIWYCGKTWCVKCQSVVLWWQLICHMTLFCFPLQIVLKFYLSFLFNITAPQNWIKNILLCSKLQ